MTLLYCLKVDHRPDGPLEILVFGTCLPDEPLKLRFTPIDLSSIPTSLNPTSKGDVVHPRKMPLYGHLPVFSHNQSVLAGHTENPDGVPNVQQQQIRLRLGVFTSEITGRPVLLLTTPPKNCETSSPSGWRMSEPIPKPHPFPSRRLSHIDVIQVHEPCEVRITPTL